VANVSERGVNARAKHKKSGANMKGAARCRLKFFGEVVGGCNPPVIGFVQTFLSTGY